MDKVGKGGVKKLEGVNEGNIPSILLFTPGGTEGEVEFRGGGNNGDIPMFACYHPFSHNVMGVVTFKVMKNDGDSTTAEAGLGVARLASWSPVLAREVAMLFYL